MILQNKKTGEKVEMPASLKNMFILWNEACKRTDEENEWEILIEQKLNYYISADGIIRQSFEIDNDRLMLGNSFETEEEAEKAVEKLKAWKRLKNKGFEFTGWDRHPDFPRDFRITASDEYTCDDKDLDLLFGGEE